MNIITRRQTLLGLAASAAAPLLTGCMSIPAVQRSQTISYFVPKLGRTYEVDFASRNAYKIFCEATQDVRAGIVATMDPDLLETHRMIAKEFGATNFALYSGYRTKSTNDEVGGQKTPFIWKKLRLILL